MPFINPPYRYDFSLRHGVGRGMRLTFMPATVFTNGVEEAWEREAEIRAGRLEAVNVSDELYAFINTSLMSAYPRTGLFSYTGLGLVPSYMWPEAGREVRWLAGRLRMRSLKQVDLHLQYFGGGAVGRFKARRTYEARRVEIADALCAFAETCDRWARRWPLIVNHGL